MKFMVILSFLLSTVHLSVAFGVEAVAPEGAVVFEKTSEYLKYYSLTPSLAVDHHGKAVVQVKVENDCMHANNTGCMQFVSYDDNWEVPHLFFDPSQGKAGAIIYNDGSGQTICAYRRRWIGTLRHTGRCQVEFASLTSDQYTVHLRVIPLCLPR